jgi:quercetin dioxygenase-like cupin family protein
MAEFRHLDEAKNFGERHWGVPGLDQRVLTSSKELTIVYVKIPAGTEFPVHSHPEEQIGFQVSGQTEFTTDGGTLEVGPGTAYHFLPGEPHGSRVLGDEPVVQIDVFRPARWDYLEASGEDGERGASRGTTGPIAPEGGGS